MSETMRTIDEKIAMHNINAARAINMARKHSYLSKKWEEKYKHHLELIQKLSKYTNTEVR